MRPETCRVAAAALGALLIGPVASAQDAVPVIAWGLGLDRMAMMALGKNDIRHLFTNNLPRGLADNRIYEEAP